MPADRGELEFYSARVFIPKDLLPAANQALAAANLHPMTRANAAVLRLSRQDKPIAGHFVEVAGTNADINGLPEVLAGLGLSPDLFAPVAWGILANPPIPQKYFGSPRSFDF